MSKKENAAPRHLRPATRKWYDSVVAEYELLPHDLHLLCKCAEAFDRCEQAREAIAIHGLTMEDRFGSAKARPEVAIERDSRTAFARLLRELDLSIAEPSTSRPPSLRSNRG